MKIWLIKHFAAWFCLGFIGAAFAQAQHLVAIHTQLAIEYAKVGRLALAQESAQRALKLDKEFVPAWLAQAVIHAALGQDDLARDDYLYALRLSPRHPDANNNYGQFLLERGQLEEAMPFFKMAGENPLYEFPQVAYFNLGQGSVRLNRPKDAEYYFVKALRFHSCYTPALKELTALALANKQAQLALSYFTRLKTCASELNATELEWGIQIAQAAGHTARAVEYNALLKSRFPDDGEIEQAK